MNEGQDIQLPSQDYPNRRFKLVKKLRASGQGLVYSASSQAYGNNSDKEVVLKFCIKKPGQEQEIMFLKQLMDYQNSPGEINYPCRMIRILDLFEYREYLVTIMEQGDVDLSYYLDKNRTNIPLNQKYQICLDIVLPIYFLHSNGLIHRDIKPENYLKVENKFKLINFGFIKRMVPNEQMTRDVGTLIFQAPEIMDNQQNYTQKVDIWSLGCLFYEIFQKEPLFGGSSQDQIRNQIKNIGTNFSYIENKINQLQCDLWFKNLMIRMLQPDQSKRINAMDIIIELQSNSSPEKTLFFPNQNQNQQGYQSTLKQTLPLNKNIPTQQSPSNQYKQPSIQLQQITQRQTYIQEQPQQQINNQQQSSFQINNIQVQAQQIQQQLNQNISDFKKKIAEIEKSQNNQDLRFQQIQEENISQTFLLISEKNLQTQKLFEERLNQLEEKLNLNFQQQLLNLQNKLKEEISKQVQCKIESYDGECITQLKQDNITLELKLQKSLKEQQNQLLSYQEDQIFLNQNIKEVSQIQQTINKFDKQASEQQENLSSRLSMAYQKIETLENQKREQEKLVAEQQQKLIFLNEEIKKQMNFFKEKELQEKKLGEQLQQQSSENQVLIQTTEQFLKQLSQKQTEIELSEQRSKEQQKQFQEQINQEKQKFQNLDLAYLKLKKEFDDVKNEVQIVNNKQMNQNLDLNNQTKKQVLEDQQKLRTTLDQTQNQLTKSNQDNRQLEEQLDQIKQDKKKIENEKVQLQNQIFQLANELSEVKQLPNLANRLAGELEKLTFEERYQIIYQNSDAFEKFYDWYNIN